MCVYRCKYVCVSGAIAPASLKAFASRDGGLMGLTPVVYPAQLRRPH